MAAKTFTGTGNWSDTTKWDLGVLPITGDTVTISGGSDATMDTDTSGFATGLAGVLINGILRCGAGYLKMDGTSGHNITFGAAGQFLGGSVGTPIAVGTVFTLDLNGASSIVASGGASGCIAIYCTQPTHTFVKLTAQANSGQAVLAVDGDVTGGGDTSFWAASHLIHVVNINKARDVESINFSSATSTTVTLVSNLSANKIANSYAVITWRNIRIINGTGIAINSATGAVLQCEISIGAAGTGMGSCVSCMMSGIIHRPTGSSSNGTTSASACTISGIICNCSTSAMSNGTNNLISGMLLGIGTADLSSNNHFITGVIAGCTTGYNSRGGIISGSIIGCTTNLIGQAILNGATLSGATQDIGYAAGTSAPFVIGYGASLNSTTQVQTPTGASAVGQNTVILFDAGGVAGAVKWWGAGQSSPGISDTGTNTLTNAPSGLTQFKLIPGSAALPTYFDIPFWGRNGVAINLTVHCKKDTNAMTETPNAQIIDPDKQLFLAGADVLATATMADNTNLQALTLSYTPTADRPLVFRFRGKHASGNFWFAVQGLGGEPAIQMARVFTGF